MNFSIRTCWTLSTLAALASLAACGGGGGGSAAVPMGTLSVSMTDAPSCGYDAVNVTVSKVRVHQSSSADENTGGWSEVTLNPARKINLLNLTNGVLDNLGQTALPVGHYTQLRLVLAPNSNSTPLANSVTPTGGVETALDTPSGVQSGIKLGHQFDVAANTLVDLTLDFDACKSIVTRGNGSYGLKPVITVIPMVTSGAIAGFVSTSILSSMPIVTAQRNGVVVKGTVPDPVTGAFTLSPIVQSSTAGTYTIVITGNARTTSVVANVPVIAKAVTTISTSTTPFSLATSSVASVSGTVLPASAQAVVTALQSLGTAPVVASVAFRNVDSVSGAYALSLPTAAPQLGDYGSGVLPITFAAQGAAAAKYTIETLAVGYAKQSRSVDLSSGNVVHNVLLQ